MSKIAIMQPYFFPYLGYFQLINTVDKFVLYDNVNFIKKGWINRNKLLSTNGKSKFFTIPLANASSNNLIQNTEIHKSTWQYKFIKLLQHNYKSSLFFEETMELIYSCVNTQIKYISKFNNHCIKLITSHLEINTQLLFDDDFEQLEIQLNNTDASTRKETRIVNICQLYKSNIYINPIGGLTLYNKDIFKEKNIQLLFIKMKCIHYRQPTNPLFIKNLSIIDVLMNCGKIETKKLLREYSLI